MVWWLPHSCFIAQTFTGYHAGAGALGAGRQQSSKPLGSLECSKHVLDARPCKTPPAQSKRTPAQLNGRLPSLDRCPPARLLVTTVTIMTILPYMVTACFVVILPLLA